MKFQRKSSKVVKTMKAAANAKDISATNVEAVHTQSRTKGDTKSKKKKFALFSKSKKGTPQKKRTSKITNTPDTVKESPVKAEKELEENSPWARDLLAELDMADTDAGADGEAEGMELILPSPKYEVEEEEQNEIESTAEPTVEPTVEPATEPTTEAVSVPTTEPTVEADAENKDDELNKSEEQPDEEPVERTGEGENENVKEDTNEENDDREEQQPEKQPVVVDENEAVVVEEKKEDDMDATEKKDGKSDQELQNKKEPLKSAANAAVQLLATALSCAVPATQELGETIYENSFLSNNTVNLDNMFNEKSGSEFLHDMTNVGFTLVHHKAVDEDSWVGRTVNMVFRPGACSSQEIVQPVIEWNTMAGGKSSLMETKTLDLLSIDAVTTSDDAGATDLPSLPIPAKPPTAQQTKDVSSSMSLCSLSFTPTEEEEFDCFFTITSDDGEIHLFEALSAKECYRVVAGIRYSAQRLSQILIEGNSSVLMSDFYDNSRVPEESKLTKNELLNKLSNAFLGEQ